MRKTTILLAVLAVAVFGLTGLAEEDNLVGYQTAVSNYFEVSLDAVQNVLDAGVTYDEIPVVFHTAQIAKVSPESIAAERQNGSSWDQIAAAHDLNTADFYVHYTDKVDGTRFSRVYNKFEGLSRAQLDEVKLADDDYVCLANLRFLYKHYNYSQRVIMNWAADGKSFAQINDLVYAATTEMNTTSLATND